MLLVKDKRLTATAKLWVPALPAVPVIKEIKTAKMLARLSKFSKCEIKVAVIIPKNSKVINHGNRLLAAFTGVLLDSSTSTPANLE